MAEFEPLIFIVSITNTGLTIVQSAKFARVSAAILIDVLRLITVSLSV